MRRLLVLLHRWLGLFLAVFLLIAGVTGALIAWDHELDGWLNPRFYRAQSAGKPLAPLELVKQVEGADPHVLVTYVPLVLEPDHALQLGVRGRLDPRTKAPFELGFDQMAVDPVSGAVQSKRTWGEVSLSPEKLMPFLYKLHYSLHLPYAFGFETGVVLMGIVALVWAIDAFVALWISFPSAKSWRRSFAFRFRAGAHKLTFDLHRSGGVWVWALLLTLAVTGAAMNLRRQVAIPLVSLFSSIEKDWFDGTPRAPGIEPKLTREQALVVARAEALRRGIQAPAGGLSYSPEFGVYSVGFFHADNAHGDGSLGNPWLHFDDQSGKLKSADVPGQGSAGDVFMQAQYPLHSGRLGGVAGRTLVSLLGVVVSVLCVTGVLLWARKRRARVWQEKARREPTETLD
ncbi:MAG: PepSY-associated TM helix domain-containing protein [Polyangiaceae bacterium]